MWFKKQKSEDKWFWSISSGLPCMWWPGNPPPKQVAKNQFNVLGIRWKKETGKKEEYYLDYDKILHQCEHGSKRD